MNDMKYICKAIGYENDWIYGYYLGADGIGYETYDDEVLGRSCIMPIRELNKKLPVYWGIDIDTLCKCSGVKDKNKNYIYENDFVSLVHCSTPCIYICKYGEYMQDGNFEECNSCKCLGFYLEYISSCETDKDCEPSTYHQTISIYGDRCLFDTKEFEIVGNKFHKKEDVN